MIIEFSHKSFPDGRQNEFISCSASLSLSPSLAASLSRDDIVVRVVFKAYLN